MGARREVRIEPGTEVELTSLRTGRKTACRIDEVIGTGGTASVFGGTLADGGLCVLKSPRWEGEHDAGFEVELELFKSLFHRNIIHCVGVGSTPGGSLLLAFRRAYENPLLLMTRASVDESMRRDKKALYPSLPIDTAIDLGYELLNALEYVEKLGYVHHDVKLANLLLDVGPTERPLDPNEVFARVVRREYRGVLIDFGATRSRLYLEAWNRGEVPPGLAPQITPLYAPPEAVVEARRPDGSLGYVFDPSLDVYAAALVLYAMFTGYPPYAHLRTPPDPSDLESVIAVKSAERRGEIEPTSAELVGRAVFEDTRFTGGDRQAWDLAFHRMLGARLVPDPAKRGTAAALKREFEQVMQIRAARADASGGDLGARGGKARVYLPFTQELVRVGSGGEHPLLRAARAYGVTAREGQAEPARAASPPPGGGRPSAAQASTQASGRSPAQPPSTAASGLDWLGDTPDDAAPGPRAPVDEARRPATRRHDRRPPDAGAPDQVATRRPPRPPPPTRPPAPREDPALHQTERRLVFAAPPTVARDPGEAGASRPPPAHAAARPPLRAGAPARPGAAPEDPTGRAPPPRARAAAPHCLLSVVLDEPFLLAREAPVTIGRDARATVRIKSDLVSRRHAEVRWTDRGFVVEDLGSVNGTLVNGAKISGPCPLHDGDRISISGFELLVRVLDGGDPALERPGGGTTRVMRADVAQRLKGETLVGELAQLALKDVVELLEWKRHTGTLLVTPEAGGPGRLFFVEGQLVHADTRRGARGLAAAVEVFGTVRGRFAFTPGAPRVPRSIPGGNDDLWAALDAGPPD